jgi:hypothetical protein
MCLQVMVHVHVLLVALIVTLFVAERGNRSGRWAWAQAFAHRFKTSGAASHVAGFFSIVTTLRMSLQLLWYTTIDAGRVR